MLEMYEQLNPGLLSFHDQQPCTSSKNSNEFKDSVMADVKALCTQTFKHFVEVTSVGQNLTEADKKEIKDKGINKMLKECCGDAVAKAAEAQVFPKYCDKKTKKLALEVFLGDFILELAAVLEQNKKKLTKRPELSDPGVVAHADELRQQIAAKHDTSTKAMGVDATTARLTDTKGYTGSHKERFDESGKGKGLAGTHDAASNSGYVSGYKGESTYDKTHK